MKRGTVALFPQVLKKIGTSSSRRRSTIFPFMKPYGLYRYQFVPINVSGASPHTVGPTGRSFLLEPTYTLGSNSSGPQVFQVYLQIISLMSYYKTP